MNDENERSVASTGSVADPASTPKVSHTLAEMYHALVVAHKENARLREAISRLAEQDATLSVCDRVVTVTMDAALTPEEREAIWTVAEAYAENDGDPECEKIARIMQGLWQRTK